MRNIVSICLVVAFVALSLFTVTSQPTLAGQSLLNTSMNATMVNVGTQAGVQTNTGIIEIVGRVIKIILALLGVIVLVLIIYAGFLWMTAGGNPEQVDKAKQWLTNAVIGLAIILAAYAITGFVVDNLFAATA